ncbi:MAG: C10 family peptidase [Planctomycetota bacterium]
MSNMLDKRTRTKLTAAVACVIVGALFTAPLDGAEVTKQSVTAAIETWVRHVTADARPDAVVEHLEAYTVDGVTAAYIAHLAEGGYCICGADDRLIPITLYSTQGTFDPHNPDHRFLLKDIDRRLAFLEQATRRGDPVLDQYRELLADRAAYWRDLAARRVPAPSGGADDRGDPQLVTLPVNDYWSQHSPFNDDVPLLTPGSDEHPVVGCVGTALAEILYYWQWPITGEGSNTTEYHWRHANGWISTPLANDPHIAWWWPSFDMGNRLRYDAVNHRLEMNGYWDGSMYGEAMRNWDDPEADPDPEYAAALELLWDSLPDQTTSWSANFGTATYDWSLLKDSHSDPVDAGDIEAAKLSRHTSVAVNMWYGMYGSSASHDAAAAAYRIYFRYDLDAVKYNRNVNTMVSEIQWFRPLQLAGDDGTVGHSWVVAGYNTGTTPTEFLMNMGWGGGTTVWYSVDEIYPSNQNHVVQIAPEGVVRFVDYGVLGGDGSPNDPYHGLDYALWLAPEETTLVLKAGSTHTLPGDPVVMDKPMILKGYDVYVTKE